jgi:hypothetical protein
MKIPEQHQKHFKGKVCTIFTTAINRDFQQENPSIYPKQLYKYFVGVVEDITDYGILIQQVVTGLRSWIFLSHVVSIAEEVVEFLTKDDVMVIDKPEQSVKTSELRQQFPNEFPDFDVNNPHANIEALQKIAELAKKQGQQNK